MRRETAIPYQVQFNRPYTTQRELGYIAQAIVNNHLSGNGPFTRRCESWLEQAIGARRALLTHSCTAALEMAAILADVGAGDEIIMPAFTFVSTANAFVLRGGVPVFVDVEPGTLNIDAAKIEAAVTPRTRAVVPVHYGGTGCDMDAILAIAARHGLMVIEDAAQAMLSTYDGRPLGSFGALAALSFHETKNVHSGEGGALLINDPALVERAEIIREKGTNRAQFFRGEVDKYTWVDVGSSFLPSDMIAAFLLAQLEEAHAICDRRRAIWWRYHELLAPLEREGLLRRPAVPEERSVSGHLYFVLVESLEARTRTLAALEERGIKAVFHYVPLDTSPAGRRYGRACGELTVTHDASDRLIRLPLWPEMTEDEIDLVVRALHDVLQS
ncbi:MAG TPA: dTDP-4-amino-4,6-dideoxygalactose transaminase [Thermoanaerobaculia bacterium]|jgi:dTDP-4-amino-4,6-dideoxygalactose transaminase